MNYDKNKVLDAVKLSELAAHLGIKLKRVGRGYKSSCPFPDHPDNKPSFILYDNEDDKTKKGFWECKGCSRFGDVFELVSVMKNKTFDESVNFVGEFSGIEPEILTKEQGIMFAMKKSLEPLLEDCAIYFRNNLSAEVIDHLKEDRKLKDETIEKFEIGYAPKNVRDLKTYLFKRGYTREQLLSSGVFSEKSGFLYPIVFDRIIFPLRNAKNELIGFNARTFSPDQEGNKYILLFPDFFNNKSKYLYGLNIARQEQSEGKTQVLIVEGVFDAIKLYQETNFLGICVLGATIRTENIERIVKFLDISDVYIALDGDDAGRSGAMKFVNNYYKKSLEDNYDNLGILDVNLSFLDLPFGLDIDEILSKDIIEDGNTIEKLVENSRSFIDFVIDVFSQEYNLRHPDGQDRFIKRVLSIVKTMNVFQEEIYLLKIAEKSGVDVEFLKEKTSILKIDFLSGEIEQLERALVHYIIKKAEISKTEKSLLSRDSLLAVSGNFSNFSSKICYLAALDTKPKYSLEKTTMFLALYKVKKLINSFESLSREKRKYISQENRGEIEKLFRSYSVIRKNLL